MKRITSLLGLLLVLTCGLAGQAAATASAPGAAGSVQALEQGILTGLNETRVAHGLKPVRSSNELRNAAAFHSRSMLELGFFAHESADGSPFSDRLKRYYSPRGYTSWSVGENLLFTTAEIDPAAAIQAWLDSPGHRRILLSPGWREVGVSAQRSDAAAGTFGGEPTWVITTDFGFRTGATGQARKPQARVTISPR